MPRIARQVGYLTGCAARYLTSARNRFAEFARDSELTQVHPISSYAEPSRNNNTGNHSSRVSAAAITAEHDDHGSMPAQLHQEMRSTLTTMQRIQEDLRRGVGLPNARRATSVSAAPAGYLLAFRRFAEAYLSG